MTRPCRTAAAGPVHVRSRVSVRACCGGKATPGRIRNARPAPPARFFFRYTGPTQLTVAGPVSGKYYRFPAPRTTVEADPRDVAALDRVPQLMRV
jgi:hypothetical protein